MKKSGWLTAIAAILLAFCFALAGCSDGKEETPEQEAKRLEKPSQVAVTEAGVVTWAAVENADYYDVYIDSDYTATVSETTYTVNITVKGEYEITICALSVGNQYETSEMSSPVVYTVDKSLLAAPAISLSGNIISWSAVPGATGYEIYQDEKLVETVQETSYVLSNLTEIGSWAIKVKAVSSNADYDADSEFSNEIVYRVFDKTVYFESAEPIEFDNTAAAVLAPESLKVSNKDFKANQVLKTALYLTTGTMSENVTARNVNYYQLSVNILNSEGEKASCTFAKTNYYSIFSETEEKVCLTYLLKLPEGFDASADSIQLEIDARPGLDFTVDKVLLTGAGYDFGMDPEYVLLDESTALEADSSYSAVSEEEYGSSSVSHLGDIAYMTVYDKKSYTGSGTGEEDDGTRYEPGVVLGADCGGSSLISAGQILKVALYLDVKSISDADGQMTLWSTYWKTEGNVLYNLGFCKIPYSDLVVGKNIVVAVLQIPDTFVSITENYFTFVDYIGEGIEFELIKYSFVGADYDLGTDQEYYLAYEGTISDALAPTGAWTPSTKNEKPLAKPIISLDANAQKISWEALEGAIGYEIYVNDEKVGTTEETNYTFDYDEPEDYVIKVNALYENGKSAFGNEVTLTVRAPRTDVLWDANYGENTFGSDTEEFVIEGLTSGLINNGANLPCKIGYFITINKIPEEGAAISFIVEDQPYFDGNWGTVVSDKYELAAEDMVVGKKILVIIVMQLTDGGLAVDGPQGIQPKIQLGKGVSVTLDNFILAEGDHDFGQYTDYEIVCEEAFTGALKPTGSWTQSTIIEKPQEARTDVLWDADYGENTFGSDTEEFVIKGLGSGLIDSGANLPCKIGYFITIDKIPEEGAVISFIFAAQPNYNGDWGGIVSDEFELAAEDMVVGQKILVIMVMQLTDGGLAVDGPQGGEPQIRLGKGVSVTLDNFVIAEGDYDFGQYTDYEIVCEEAFTGALKPTGSWTPSSAQE